LGGDPHITVAIHIRLFTQLGFDTPSQSHHIVTTKTQFSSHSDGAP